MPSTEELEAPLFHIVLVNPEIPGNTGSIGRTALAVNAKLHLIHPLGFDINEKAVRRAGLDYWPYVNLKEHLSFEAFLNKERPKQLFFFSSHAKSKSFFDVQFNRNCYLVFGPESTGLKDNITQGSKGEFLSLPILTNKIRSLNLANCVTAVSYECLRQIKL